MSIPSKEDQLAVLTERWKKAKAEENEAETERLNVEQYIVTLIGKDLPKKGTYRLSDGLKIVTGTTDKWDQEELDRIAKKWPTATGTTPFPFRSEWKPDGKAIGYIRNHVGKLYEKLLPALTSNPKKPSFSDTSEGNGEENE